MNTKAIKCLKPYLQLHQLITQANKFNKHALTLYSFMFLIMTGYRLKADIYLNALSVVPKRILSVLV